MQIKKGDRHRSRVMRTSRALWQRCLLKSLLIYSTERRKHAHTTPSHVNRQTDKECAWGRPRLLHTVSKCYFLWSFVTCHERATAWLFHVGTSQYYCVSHLSSHRNNCGHTIQVSCLKDKPTNGATSEVIGQPAPQYYTHLCKVKRQAHAVVYFNVANLQEGLGVLHPEVWDHCVWLRAWEGPRIVYVVYTK